MSRAEILELVCGCLGTIGIFPAGSCTEETSIDTWSMEARERFLECLVNKGRERGVGILVGPESLDPPITVGEIVDVVEASI